MRRLCAVLVTVVLCAGLLPSSVSAGNSQYFPETGQTSSNAFYEFWQTHGALEILGLPVSPSYRDRAGLIIQVYERAVMEWHPENTRDYRVLLERLGARGLDALKDNETGSKVGKNEGDKPARPCPVTGNCRIFAETNHTVTGAFYDYWREKGGLATFGYPLSEEVDFCENDLAGPSAQSCGRMYTSQVFERNVFEWHPEINAGSVLLRRLGALVWVGVQKQGFSANATASVPDYDGVASAPVVSQNPSQPTSNPPPPPVYTPPPPAPVYSPPPAPVYTPPPAPVYSPPPVQQSSGPVSGSNGVCPAGYPVKANDNSGIYHRPGQQFYDATNARNCFATAAAAEAAGYRASKV